MRVNYQWFFFGLQVLIGCLGNGQTAYAIQVANLYQTDIAVEDRQAVHRNQALDLAFEQVIGKVSGQPEAETHSLAQPLPTNMDTFISGYSYKQINKNLHLSVKFNEKMINQWLVQKKQAYLGKSRPLTVVWVVVDSGGTQDFLGAGGLTALGELLEQVGNQKGVPVMLPLLDLMERSTVSQKDVQHFSRQVLEQASKRYQADLVLAANIRQVGNHWKGHIKLFGSQTNERQIVASSLENQLSDVVSFLATQLVQQYGISSQPATSHAAKSIRLQVEGVKSVAEYAKVLYYLKGLSAVQDVDIEFIAGSTVVLKVQAEGGQQAVVQAMKLDNLLIREYHAAQTEANELVYRINL